MASPEQMAQSMIDNMTEKTGKDLDAWLSLVAGSGLEKHGQIVKWLKSDHGMTHGYANLVAHRALRKESADTDPIAAQYSGAKAGLRPIYDALMAKVNEFGDDVESAPKKAYVSLRRRRQFGLIQPSTKTRLDVGIQLSEGAAESDRLELSKSWNSMVSHRVRVTDLSQVDDELVGWLRQAYEQAE